MRSFVPSVALVTAAFLLGCQEQGSGPVGPEGLGMLLDKEGITHTHGGGENGDEATFTATWTAGGDITGDPIFLLGGGPNLQTKTGMLGVRVPAKLDLSFFRATPDGGGYTADQGALCFGDDEYTAGFSIIVKKNDLKNATANFAAFTAKSNDGNIDVHYGLALFGVITEENQWPPKVSNTITWRRFEMIHQGGPGRNVGCFGTGSLKSVMKVTRN